MRSSAMLSLWPVLRATMRADRTAEQVEVAHDVEDLVAGDAQQSKFLFKLDIAPSPSALTFPGRGLEGLGAGVTVRAYCLGLARMRRAR